MTTDRQLLGRRFEEKSPTRFHWRSPEQESLIRALIDALTDGALPLEPLPCPCGSPDSHVIAERDRYGFPLLSQVCQSCGTVRFDPYLSPRAVDTFYRLHYQQAYARCPDVSTYFTAQASIVPLLVDAYRLCRKQLTPDSKVLEIGCGAGGAVRQLQCAGIDAGGCDLSEPLITFGRNNGVANLHYGEFDTCDWAPSGSCDLVYAIHVAEHIVDIERFLLGVGALLRPGGVAIIVVPDIYGLGLGSYSSDILQFLHIAHPYNFTYKCLSLIAGRLSLCTKRLQIAREWGPELWVALGDVEAIGPSTYREEDYTLAHLKTLEKRYRKRTIGSHFRTLARRIVGIRR